MEPPTARDGLGTFVSGSERRPMEQTNLLSDN